MFGAAAYLTTFVVNTKQSWNFWCEAFKTHHVTFGFLTNCIKAQFSEVLNVLICLVKLDLVRKYIEPKWWYQVMFFFGNYSTQVALNGLVFFRNNLEHILRKETKNFLKMIEKLYFYFLLCAVLFLLH